LDLSSIFDLIDNLTDRGPLPPTAWKYVWLPKLVDIFAGSERDRLTMPLTPEKVTASKKSLSAILVNSDTEKNASSPFVNARKFLKYPGIV
jgi:hypothetical protein